MALESISTCRETLLTRETPAARLVVDRVTLELTHDQVSERTAEQIKALLDATALTSRVELPTITAHVNRDGSIALATGTLDRDFVWPEDELKSEIGVTPRG